MDDQSKSDGIGGRLRGERERLGLSQIVFAQAGGVKRVTQYLYEQGDRSPDSEYLLRLHEIGVDVVWVLLGELNSESKGSAANVESIAERLRLVKKLSQQIAKSRKALGLRKSDESTLMDLLAETLLSANPRVALQVLRNAESLKP